MQRNTEIVLQRDAPRNHKILGTPFCFLKRRVLIWHEIYFIDSSTLPALFAGWLLLDVQLYMAPAAPYDVTIPSLRRKGTYDEWPKP